MPYMQERVMFARDLECGDNVVIGEEVSIGEGCVIGSNVVIHPGTVIGRNVQIGDNSVIGKTPLRSKHSAVTKAVALEPCVIGDDCLIGALVVLFRGCRLGEAAMVADQASVREEVTVGAGTIIGRGVAIENKVTIGARCKIETGAYVTALSTIGDHCFIAPEVTFTNDRFVARTKERFLHHRGVTMERGARIGANATVLPGLTLGEDCLVAAASVVTRDVAPRTVVLGVPARTIRPVPVEQLLENQ
jgi:UDP-2-acetamido-3-amino-2,3-dideoxy-glucuronate N-acetyltransferase